MGLNSGGEGLRLTDFKLSLRGMQGVYREEQPELAVWRLLYGVRAVILRLGGFRQYLWGADRRAFFSVDSPGSLIVGILDSGCEFQV